MWEEGWLVAVFDRWLDYGVMYVQANEKNNPMIDVLEYNCINL